MYAVTRQFSPAYFASGHCELTFCLVFDVASWRRDVSGDTRMHACITRRVFSFGVRHFGWNDYSYLHTVAAEAFYAVVFFLVESGRAIQMQ